MIWVLPGGATPSAGELRFAEPTGWGAGAVNDAGIKAPADILNTYTWTLPDDLPGSTLCITVDNLGVMGYGACSGGAGLPLTMSGDVTNVGGNANGLFINPTETDNSGGAYLPLLIQAVLDGSFNEDSFNAINVAGPQLLNGATVTTSRGVVVEPQAVAGVTNGIAFIQSGGNDTNRYAGRSTFGGVGGPAAGYSIDIQSGSFKTAGNIHAATDSAIDVGENDVRVRFGFFDAVDAEAVAISNAAHTAKWQWQQDAGFSTRLELLDDSSAVRFEIDRGTQQFIFTVPTGALLPLTPGTGSIGQLTHRWDFGAFDTFDVDQGIVAGNAVLDDFLQIKEGAVTEIILESRANLNLGDSFVLRNSSGVDRILMGVNGTGNQAIIKLDPSTSGAQITIESQTGQQLLRLFHSATNDQVALLASPTTSSHGLLIGPDRVVGPQQAAVADPTGGTTVDSEARTAISALISRLETHGLIAN